MVDDRDGRRCVRCGRSLYAVGGSRHHRKLRSQCTRVEKHQVQNLILLCGADLAWTRVSHHRRQIFIDKGTIK